MFLSYKFGLYEFKLLDIALSTVCLYLNVFKKSSNFKKDLGKVLFKFISCVKSKFKPLNPRCSSKTQAFIN